MLSREIRPPFHARSLRATRTSARDDSQIINQQYNRNKANHVNEKYFANIDSANKAYFLGFIMADGNMYQHEDGKLQFSIKIKNTDKDILYKFADEIEFPKDKIIEREEEELKNLED